jgi:hypothetical protein
MCCVTQRAMSPRPYDGEVETSSARRLLCSVASLGDPSSDGGGGRDGEIAGVGGSDGGGGEEAGEDRKGKGKRRSIKKGRFLGSSRAFAPPPEALNASDSRVFLLTGRVFRHCLLVCYWCNRMHQPHPRSWPGLVVAQL